MATTASLKADLVLKETALKDTERTLRFFRSSKDCSPELIKDVEKIISTLKGQISMLERDIAKRENVKKKK